MKKAFTLVELSIVLVIIGLLTAGVVGGQSLVESAKINSVVSDFQKFDTAANAFKLEYDALPGDMRNATDYWGAVSGDCETVAGTGTQTCNGDGDGKIGNENRGIAYETIRAWEQLSFAGIIQGNYTGAWHSSCANTSRCFEGGLNAPNSKISKTSVYSLRYLDVSDSWRGKNSSRNLISLGEAKTSGRWHDRFLTGKKTSQIDKKIDDNLPFSGRITNMSDGFSSTDCFTGTDLSTTAVYNLTSTTAGCILYYDLTQ